MILTTYRAWNELQDLKCVTGLAMRIHKHRSAPLLMVQGTASSAGKSVLVTALCRILRQDGYRVAPFKAQNMALNSYVTPDGGEIGRSQAVQADAAGAEMSVDMNPVLLKPEADSRCQVVVLGKPWVTLKASEYYQRKAELWSVVSRSLERLRTAYDVVVIEGAGSPAEINLRESDIVNMKVAREMGAPVLLVGDIDRGGVFASLVGTMVLLTEEERALVKGMVINRFRGDPSLLRPGLQMLEERTNVPVVGVIPYYRDIHLPDEDSVSLEGKRTGTAAAGLLDIAVIRLGHISNFDDFDPLEREPGVHLRYVSDPAVLGHPDLIILPGTKTTVNDLQTIRANGLAASILEQARQGAAVIGICGGYQMLGQRILDPEHVESSQDEVPGLGLLPLTTTFAATKQTCRARCRIRAGQGLLEGSAGLEVTGYEIHMGETEGAEMAVLEVKERSGQPVQALDGATSPDGRVFGVYLHGIFANDAFRRSLLASLARGKAVRLSQGAVPAFSQEEHYDRLAALVRQSLDMPYIYSLLEQQCLPEQQ